LENKSTHVQQGTSDLNNEQKTGIYIRLLLLLSLVALFWSMSVMGIELRTPYSYVIEAGDYVFVMLPEDVRNDRKKALEKKAEYYNKNCKQVITDELLKRNCNGIKVARRYLHSGMYKKNEPSKPLWTLNWYWYSRSKIYPSPDGEHLAFIGGMPGGSNTLEVIAVAFSEKGKFLKEYLLTDLVKDKSTYKGIFRLSRFKWWEKIQIIDSTLFVRTVDFNEYIFDMHTGNIISQEYKPGSQGDISPPQPSFTKERG